ncbi:MAG: UDP-N-acetylmuramoyl-tripeptide--D-alanyl-D-alanine ligase, partial [Planctomycetota bacterium]
LGDGAEEAHRELGRRAVAAGVDELIAVGEGGAWLAAGAAEMGDARVRVRLVDEAGEAAALVVAELPERALLLLKASRSEGLERVRMSLFAARPLAVQEGAA